MHPDKETQDIISDGQLLRQLTEAEGWKVVKRIADEMAHDLLSWTTLPDDIKTATAKVAEMERRTHAVALFKDLIARVEGQADQGTELAKSFKKATPEISQIYTYKGRESN